ncbi:hypothetical protein [uncultured Sulfitobacter sp.]|uniref:hypothetical protein n=1 Tax=uncultured Sulfitobacter sp. TaxID=191468 RepID=UPI00262906FD|nr:hypothetical protein [uncultured Sulfitobacter sp.]
MALRLSRSIGISRRIDVGYGVVFLIAPFTFAEYKEVEASSLRLARGALPPAMALDVEALDDEDMPIAVEDATRGLFASKQLSLMLRRFGVGWEGVETEEGAAAPFEGEAIDQFLEMFPGAAQQLQQALLSPYLAVTAEGKGSALSPNTGTPEG